GRIVEGSPACLANEGEDAVPLERIVRLEPVGEEILQLERQAQEDVASRRRAGSRRRLEDLLELVVVESRNHGGGEDTHGNAGLGERADRFESARGRGGARLHAACEL